MSFTKKLFGGVEGGATHSTLILFNDKSEILAEVEGPETNLFQIGLDETCHRVANMYKVLGRSELVDGLGSGDFVSGYSYRMSVHALGCLTKQCRPNSKGNYLSNIGTVSTWMGDRLTVLCSSYLRGKLISCWPPVLYHIVRN
jgi:hypothetical protein